MRVCPLGGVHHARPYFFTPAPFAPIRRPISFMLKRMHFTSRRHLSAAVLTLTTFQSPRSSPPRVIFRFRKLEEQLSSTSPLARRVPLSFSLLLASQLQSPPASFSYDGQSIAEFSHVSHPQSADPSPSVSKWRNSRRRLWLAYLRL